MNTLRKLHALYLGVKFALRDNGYLSMGLTWQDDPGYNNAFDRGANVGEWAWDAVHFQNIARMPWQMRTS
jgi:hypothetical protein